MTDSDAKALVQSASEICDDDLAGLSSSQETAGKLRTLCGVKPDPLSDFLSDEPEVKAAFDKLLACIMGDIVPAFRKPRTLMRLITLARKLGVTL